jgi:hypothetical protein
MTPKRLLLLILASCALVSGWAGHYAHEDEAGRNLDPPSLGQRRMNIEITSSGSWSDITPPGTKNPHIDNRTLHWEQNPTLRKTENRSEWTKTDNSVAYRGVYRIGR